MAHQHDQQQQHFDPGQHSTALDQILRAQHQTLGMLTILQQRIDKMAVTDQMLLDAVAAEHDDEVKIINLLSTMSTEMADLQTKLAAAIAANDHPALQSVLDQLGANKAAMDTVLGSLPPAPAPAPAPAP